MVCRLGQHPPYQVQAIVAAGQAQLRLVLVFVGHVGEVFGVHIRRVRNDQVKTLARQAVETVALRPGKPTWFGTLEDGRRILGLPGNPASAFVCAQLFLKPLILALLGRPAEPVLRTAILGCDLPANGPREQWMRASLGADGEARTVIKPFAQQDSSLVGVFSRADALLLRKTGAPAAAAGSIAQFLPLDRMY